MKQKDREQQDTSLDRREQRRGKEPITSDSVKNAHATGDGAMGRSLDSIPDEDELNSGEKKSRRQREQY